MRNKKCETRRIFAARFFFCSKIQAYNRTKLTIFKCHGLTCVSVMEEKVNNKTNVISTYFSSNSTLLSSPTTIFVSDR